MELIKTTGQVLTRNTVQIPQPVVPQSFHQLGIFVNDGSGSMAELALSGAPKSTCVGMATADTFSRFQGSTKKANFSFAIVDFDDSAAQRLDITPAVDLDPYADYTPSSPSQGGTCIAAGLEVAERLAENFLNTASEVPKSVIIVVLSDGMDGSASHTLQVAQRLKVGDKITLCACYLAPRGGHDAQAESHLRAIATDPARNYRTVYDPDTIRGFFIASLSAGNRL